MQNRGQLYLGAIIIVAGIMLLVGNFVDIEKDAFHEAIDASMTAALGDEYVDPNQMVLAERRALRSR